MDNKVFRYIPWLLILCLVCACGGGPRKTPETPDAARDGAREIQAGNLFYRKGCYRQAATHFYRAHIAFTAADHLPGIVVSLNSLGNVYQANGDLDNAIAFFDEALSISNDLGDRQSALQTLSNKAAAYIGADRLEPAEALIEAGETLAAKPFLPLQINRGILLVKKGDYPPAQTVLEKALTSVDGDDRSSRAKIHFALGRLMGARGDTDGAIEHFRQALDNDRAIGFYKGMAQDHTWIGDVYRQQDSHKKALSHYKQAVQIYALVNDAPHVGEVMEKLEAAAAATGTDIRITTHFVKTWLEDKSLKRPCR